MRLSNMFLAAGLACAAAGTVATITFDDITARSGVTFVSNASPTDRKQQPESMLGGVAIFDYDGDGLQDLYFVNGAGMPSLEKDGEKHKNRLYKNNGNLTFTDVTDRAKVAGSGYGMGVAIGDYDNDGHPDIYVANVNGNQLFHNNGNGTFTDVTLRAKVGGGSFEGRKMWSVAAAWVDYNNDGKLDLFVSNYCRWDPNSGPDCKMKDEHVFCAPRLYKPLPNTLYRNNGDGTFTDVSVETGIAKHLGRGMGVAIADYDNDGFMDIFVANDDAPFQLFHNLAGKRFEEIALDSGAALPESGNVVSGMGADFRDLSNKGLPSMWVTGIEKETFPLLMNLGGGQFADKTAAAGIASDTFEMSGWSNAIVDLDNDGWKDLIVARSNVQDNVDHYGVRRPMEPNSIFRNLGNGRFENVSAKAGEAFGKPGFYRGMAVGDLDNDGRMDAVFTQLNGAAKIFRNTTGPHGHWLLIKLVGTRSNRMGIGARIRVTSETGVAYNHATTSTGYASSSDVRVHFGMGASDTAKEIEILWPSGVKQILTNVKADRVLTVTEK